MSRPVLPALLSLVLLAAGCGGDHAEPRKPVTPLDRTTVGTIRGEAVFDGTPPSPTIIAIGGDPACAALHEGTVTADDVRVRDGRLENVFVYIASGLGDRGFAVPTDPVKIDQRGCLYHPHVVGAQVDQPIDFLNSDPLLHNVHGSPAHSRGWNFGSVKASSRTIKIDHPEVMVSVRCDIHPWMQAYVGVLDHPYFAVTSAAGTFVLPDVPPGEYRVAAWHERFGTHETTVTVAPKETAYAEFRFSP